MLLGLGERDKYFEENLNFMVEPKLKTLLNMVNDKDRIFFLKV